MLRGARIDHIASGCVVLSVIIEHQETVCVCFVQIRNILDTRERINKIVDWHEENAVIRVFYVTNSGLLSTRDTKPEFVCISSRSSVSFYGPWIAQF